MVRAIASSVLAAAVSTIAIAQIDTDDTQPVTIPEADYDTAAENMLISPDPLIDPLECQALWEAWAVEVLTKPFLAPPDCIP